MDLEPTATSSPSRSLSQRLALWLAEGFGVGRLSIAPGTFGTGLGFFWLAALLAPNSLVGFCVGTGVGILAAVWICASAERTLQRHDPPSVVLDEIAAFPISFVGLLIAFQIEHGHWPKLSGLASSTGLWVAIAVFVAFRFFDIWKPWPIRQAQALAAGWGIVADDVIAAIYVAVLTGVAMRLGWIDLSGLAG